MSVGDALDIIAEVSMQDRTCCAFFCQVSLHPIFWFRVLGMNLSPDVWFLGGGGVGRRDDCSLTIKVSMQGLARYALIRQVSMQPLIYCGCGCCGGGDGCEGGGRACVII